MIEGPHLQHGVVETAGRVCPRASHLQLISSRTVKKWGIWSLDIKSAFVQTGSLCRDVFVHASPGSGAPRTKRDWELRVAPWLFV